MKKKRYRIVLLILFLISAVGILIGNFMGFKVSNDEKKAQELFLEGEKFLNKGNYENAIYAFRLVADNYPQLDLAASSVYEIGKIYEYHLKDLKSALNCYQEIIKDYADHTYLVDKAQYKLQIYKSSGHNWYKEVIKNYPKSSSLNITLFQLVLSSNDTIDDLLKDVGLLQEGYRGWEGLPRLRLLQAQLLSYKGDLSASAKILRNLIKILNKSPLQDLILIELANVYYKEGDYLKSKEILEKISDKSTSSKINFSEVNSLLYYGLGEVNFALSQYNSAIWYYQKIAYNFDWRKAQELYFNYFSEIMPEIKLGNCYQNNEEERIAQNVYNQFLKKNRISTEESLNPQAQKFYYRQINRAFFFLGNCYEKKGNLLLALKNYKKIRLNLEPADKEEIMVPTLVKIGNIYTILGKFDTAISYFQSLINNYPQSKYVGRALYSIGRIKETRGEEVSADYYEKIIQNYAESPDLPIIYYHFIRKKQKILAKNSPFTYIFYKEEEKIAKKYGDRVKEVMEVNQNYSSTLTHLILGDIYFFQRKFDLAKKEFQSITNIKSSDKELCRGFAIISSFTPKDKDLENRIKEGEFKKTIFLAIKKGEESLNSNLDPQINYQLSSLYQKLGWLEDAHRYFLRGLRVEPKIGKIYYGKEIKRVFTEIKEKNNLLISKLELFLEKDNPPDALGLKELKEFANTQSIKLLFILANLNWGLREKMSTTQRDLENELKIEINQALWQSIQNNYITLIPPDQKLQKMQTKLLEDVLSLYNTYIQIVEGVDIHFTSGMDLKPIFQVSKKRLIKFNNESLKNWETILEK